MEAWCADYGLAPIHKALHIGTLYESERCALERKFETLLTGKHDRYCMLVLCLSCLKNFNAKYELGVNNSHYEIV